MAHVISCHSCGQKSSVSDAIFEKRIAGKKVTLRCTQCREPIPVDGTTGELRVIPPAPSAPVCPASPAKASPPPVKASPPPQAAKASPPPPAKASPLPPPRARVTADYGQLSLAQQQPKATLLGLAGPTVKPSSLEHAAPKAALPIASQTPVPRDEMVTLDDQSADETTRIAALPSALPTPPASSPPVALAATLQAALAPVATPPPVPEASSAPPVRPAPASELELTPPGIAYPVEASPPTSTAGLTRDESAPSRNESASSRNESAPRQRGRGVARVALVSAIPLVAAAALAVGVLKRHHEIPGAGKWVPVAPSALPAVLNAGAAKLDPSPTSAPVSAPVPEPAPELAPQPGPALAEEEPSQTPPEELAIPSYVKAPVVLHRTQLALRRAERCHPYGHAVGTARVYVTFAPNGRVVDARLEGEPLAGAPVARCLLDHARSIRLPRFKGEPFTIQQEITLR